MYDYAMTRIIAQTGYESGIALKLLHWVFRAHRPLTVDEIKHALAVRHGDLDLDPDGMPDSSDLISACLGMILINEDTGIISFLHYTLQEYFDDEGHKHFESLTSDISQTCLTYLLFRDVAGTASVSDNEEQADYETAHLKEDYLLVDYAAKHWGKCHSKTLICILLLFVIISRFASTT